MDTDNRGLKAWDVAEEEEVGWRGGKSITYVILST